MKLTKFLFVLIIFTYGTAQDGVPLLRWAGPPGSRPGTDEEWLAEHPYTDFYYHLNNYAHGDGRAGTVAILIEQDIARSLIDEIEQLTDNLQSEGYTVLNYHISGGTPDTLRSLIQTLHTTDNIEGALFVGDLPVAWYEIAHDFDSTGPYVQFPIDLFYMDLNGTWLDTMNTGNGRYDGHTGNVNPEIYVGRLIPTGLGSDTTLLKNYFAKDNAYRHDILSLPKRALVFVDDDWEYWAPYWAQDVALLFADTMSYWDPETTRASVYRVKLDTSQAWVSLFAHSWPGGHAFTYNDSLSDYYFSHEYTSQDPPAHFYNFFCCSFSRYTENCGGNRAIFNETCGIGSIGSTKTGSMLDFNYFYEALGQGKTLGEAFRYWFDCIYNHVGMNFSRLCWHYGMTLLGDPFLKPLGHNLSVAENDLNRVPDPMVTLLGNPVSTHLCLNFALAERNDVQINLYDCTGRKVNHLVKKLEKGNQSVRLQMIDLIGNTLPQGIYIVRVSIDNKAVTKKIIKISQ